MVPEIRVLGGLGACLNNVLALLATGLVFLRLADDLLETGAILGCDFSHGLEVGVKELRLPDD